MTTYDTAAPAADETASTASLIYIGVGLALTLISALSYYLSV